MFIEEDLDSEATRLQMGHEANDVHANYGQQSALRRKQCQELAHFDLPKEIDWSMFEGLDFRGMASKPRVIGRPKLCELKSVGKIMTGFSGAHNLMVTGRVG